MPSEIYDCPCCAGNFGRLFAENREIAKLIAASAGSQPTGFSCEAVVDRRDFIKGGAATIGGLGLLGYSGGSAKAQSGPARVYTGGTILTVDENFSEAEAIAIQGNKILAVGPLSEVRAVAGDSVEIVDLGGKVMLPGFVEAHTHPLSGGLLASIGEYVGIAKFRTTDEVIGHLRSKAETTPEGEWIFGINYDPSLQDGPAELTLEYLDRISTEHPIFILNASGHLGYANQLAFEAAGIGEDVIAPAGAEYSRDASGKLNGVIKNNTAWLPVLFANPSAREANPSQALVDLTKKFSKVGLTTLTDLSFGGVTNGPGDAELVKAAYSSGEMAARLRAYPLTNYEEAWDKAHMTEAANQGDGLFRICGYKLIADGSNQGFTGLQREPYLNSDDRGLAYMSVEELAKRSTKWAQMGWLLSIHGNGDAGIDNALDAYQKIRDSGVDLRKARARIEHCSILQDDQIARMKDLGVQASFLIGHVHYWGVAMRDDVFGEEKARLLDRARSCEDAGVGFTLHSDYFVTEPDPLHMIEMAVTRKTWKEPDYVLAPDERISVESAIRAVTINAAWQMASEHEVGSLEVGKLADFVILDKDPRKVDPDTIKDIKVLETWMDGKQMYSA